VIELLARSFLLPKQGSSFSECEDAIARNSSSMLYAVADGATEAFGSKRWARYLTAAWVRAATSSDWSLEDLTEAVQKIGDRFSQLVGERALPWYAAEKAAGGSFAAFIGLRLKPDGSWSSVALGDCCLFEERGSELIEAFPIAISGSFGSRPVLVPSLASQVYDAATSVVTRRGIFEPGDRMWLLSDAIACWYLKCRERAETDSIESFRYALISGGRSAATSFIERERAEKRLRNDDVAVLYLEAAFPLSDPVL
jgi:hypothetical protein